MVAGALASLAGKAFRSEHMGNTTLMTFRKLYASWPTSCTKLVIAVDGEQAVATLRRVYAKNILIREGLGCSLAFMRLSPRLS